jgi:hypothetical protein
LNARPAGELRFAFAGPLERLSKTRFVRAWSSVAYLFPGLHPDDYEATDSGWPRALRRLAAEAWRRAGNGRLSDGELYPSDAQWCGLYDRMNEPTPDETARRRQVWRASCRTRARFNPAPAGISGPVDGGCG